MKKSALLLGILFLVSACSNNPLQKENIIKNSTEVPIVEEKLAENSGVEKNLSEIDLNNAIAVGIIANVLNQKTNKCRIVYTNFNGEPYKLNDEIYCNSAMRSAISPDKRFLVYVDFPNVVLFDSGTQTNTKLMSVFDNTDGVDFYWTPDGRTIAISIVNTIDSSYSSSSGTKLYILKINEMSELMRKDRYLIKMRFECHDAGCNVGPNDLYFTDNNTLIYRTWNDDPYSAVGDNSLLRTLKLDFK